jgi:uncharacterized RDD family membrane protein YckC
MSSASDDNRFAPPLAHVEDIARTGTGTLAGRGTRFLAILIDALLAGVAFGVIALLTPINVFNPKSGTSGFMGVLLIQVVLGFVIFLVIHGYLLATRGQTVGKALLKIRIVRSDGSPATFARIVGLRYLPTSVLAPIPLVGALYGLVDSLLIFRTSRRCLHDNIADTIVVNV